MQYLNVFEVETEAGPKSFLCFLDPVLAGIKGIDPHAIVGPLSAATGEEFNPDEFTVNPGFVDSFTHFMNDHAAQTPEIIAQAAAVASEWLYVLDPRDQAEDAEEPETVNVLGAFAVDEAGQIVPGSFQYNKNHTLFDRMHGISGILRDQQFYKWLHNVD